MSSDNYTNLIEEARQMAEDESEDFVVNRLADALESVVRDRNEAEQTQFEWGYKGPHWNRIIQCGDENTARFMADDPNSQLYRFARGPWERLDSIPRAAAMREEEN